MRTASAQQAENYSGHLPPPADIAARDELIPVRRPHFRRDQGRLYFLASQRPFIELEEADASLWEAIDGRANIGTLAGSFPEAHVQLERMWQKELIELSEADFPSHRKPVLIVEPHMDDAILSIGGQMWSRRHEAEMTVLTVASISNFTVYHKLERQYFDVDVISRLRQAESELVMRLLGGKLQTLGLLDAPLRFQSGEWTVAWYASHRKAVTAFMNRMVPKSAVEELAQILANRFRESSAEEIWIPLGIGRSADHELTRNACLRAIEMAPEIMTERTVLLYEEVPYLVEFPDHLHNIVVALSSCGGRIEPVTADITQMLADKLRLVSNFASQFKGSYIRPKVAEAAKQCGGAAGLPLAETAFRLVSMPNFDLVEALSPICSKVEATIKRLKSWLPQARKARQIRIVCPTGVGYWREDMTTVLAAFPDAKIELHVSAAGLGDTSVMVSDRIAISAVDPSPKHWAKCLLKLALTNRQPLVIITSFRLAKLGGFVRAALFFIPTLTVSGIDEFVTALQKVQPAPSQT